MSQSMDYSSIGLCRATSKPDNANKVDKITKIKIIKFHELTEFSIKPNRTGPIAASK